MDCHFDTHRGQFAGRAQKGACEECHSVAGFSPSSFTIKEHAECDYPLDGSHLAVPCLACHKKITFSTRRVETTQFKFNSMRCVSCHEDVHKGQTQRVSQKKSIPIGKDNCEFCHQVQSWSSISFNHDGTGFPLSGQHKITDCVFCHRKEGQVVDLWEFRDVGTACSSCHNDQHQGQFASRSGETDCAQCHTSTDWFAEKFDHEKGSKFSLKGAHQFVACKACHKAETKNGTKFVKYKPLEKKCESCHLGKSSGDPKFQTKNRTRSR